MLETHRLVVQASEAKCQSAFNACFLCFCKKKKKKKKKPRVFFLKNLNKKPQKKQQKNIIFY